MTDHRNNPHGSRHDVERLATLQDWQLENSDQDLRGHILHSRSGEPLGRIADMLVDLRQERVVALRMEDQRVVDIDDVDIAEGRIVHLASEPGGPQAGAAAVPDRRGERAHRDERTRDDRDERTRDNRDERTRDTGGERLPIVEESLEISKRVGDLNQVRVRTRVVEQPVSEDVSLRREHVELERRPADRALGRDEAESMLRDHVIEVTERGEEAVVGKTARVVEEVVVRKDVETHVERVEDSVRRTEVDVDRDSTPRGRGGR